MWFESLSLLSLWVIVFCSHSSFETIPSPITNIISGERWGRHFIAIMLIIQVLFWPFYALQVILFPGCGFIIPLLFCCKTVAFSLVTQGKQCHFLLAIVPILQLSASANKISFRCSCCTCMMLWNCWGKSLVWFVFHLYWIWHY